MPLPEKVPSFFGPEVERMITTDPVHYMGNVKTLKDPPRNTCLLYLLTHIQDKQWLLLRSAGIIDFVEQAIQSPLASSKIDAFNAYAICLEFIKNTKNKKADVHGRALKKAFKASRNFSFAAWHAVQDMPDNINADLRESFRLAVWLVLRNLSLLRDEDGPDDVEAADFANGELLLGKALLNNRLHGLALYCWLSAPDSKTRRASDVTRSALFEADIMDGYNFQQELFLKEVPPKKLRSQLDTVIRTRDATPKTLAFCLRFLLDILQTHPTSGRLGDGFGGDLADILWILMRWGDVEDHYFAPRSANELLNILLKDLPAPLRVLHTMIENHDGARLMARLAVSGAKPKSESSSTYVMEYFTTNLLALYNNGDSFFLLDQLLEHFNVPVESQSPELKVVMSVTRNKLEAIWPQTTNHLHEIDKSSNHGCKAVINRWNMLGNKAGVCVFLNPLLGCSWYKCPLYGEKTEKKAARCVRCWKVQYCSKTCQREDWKEGHKQDCEAT